jgi:hypothetical protein
MGNYKNYVYQIDKNNPEEVEEAFQVIKARIMKEWDVDEDDMDIDEVEDEVNSESKDRFQDLYGFEY